MSIRHRRRQHPVGQGFFHSGDLYESNVGRQLLYVVDCGSKAKHRLSREKQIDDFVHGVGAGDVIDLLLVSHVHEDHISGIERLLDSTTGLKVDTIMLPLTTLEERLIAFARSVDEDGEASENAFYRRFVLSPEAALSELDPRQIILVRSGSPDDGAPGRTGEPLSPFPGDEGDRDRETIKTPRDWKLVGAGEFERRDGVPTSSGDVAQIVVLPDSAGIAVPGAVDWEWLVAPYVDPKVQSGITKFERKLARCLGTPVANLRTQLNSVTYVQDLLVKHVAELTTAYKAVASDLNVTSMCVYSGPARSNSTREHWLIRSDYGWRPYSRPGRIGWLGTGDAALKEKIRLDPLLHHYGQHLDCVGTLTMPHHGSDANFHPALLDGVNPSLCVAAAAKYSNWRHPGTDVVQSVASRGVILKVATDDERSAVVEWIETINI